MTRKRVLMLFLAAGIILALILGFYFYQLNRMPSQADVRALLQTFTDRINTGDLKGARELLTADSRSLLRDPGTILGETVYRNLSLRSVDNVLPEGEGIFSADVCFTTPDTLKIMSSAGIVFAERVTENGPAEDADGVLAEIYEEILSRDDLPMLEQFCIVRIVSENGMLRIQADTSLQHALEGNSTESLSGMERIFGER